MHLSQNTIGRAKFLFSEKDCAEAITLLDSQCSVNLPFLESADSNKLERFHFAALKLSNGNLDKLKDAVILANQDWRDLLVAAGFADSCGSHIDWLPRKHGRRYNTAEQDAAANP